MADLTIRGGTLVTPAGAQPTDLAVEDGRISQIGESLSPSARDIDARGLLVLPGLIDVHLHFNEPGRADWEGAATGSRALAAGGGTLFFDMPLNSTPCTLNATEFDRKRAALEASSITDFALWGGLVPGSIPQMAELAERGVIGFKAFMCDSGLPEFPRADDATLLDGMREATRLQLPVAVHAESEEITRTLSARMSGREVRDFLKARPLVAELEAIQRALLFARETGAALHIVHISAGRGVAMAAEAKAAGVNVSIETCAHYLFFTDEDMERLGAVAKCAPPLRSADDHRDLWHELMQGHIDIVASDHSPTTPDRKRGDFVSAWGGIAGVQSTLSVLLDRGLHTRNLPIERIVSLTAAEPARRFRIRGKGSIEAGMDADVVLVNPNQSCTLTADALLQRHKTSPYLGATFHGVVTHTIRRGDTLYEAGRIVATSNGKLIRPETR